MDRQFWTAEHVRALLTIWAEDNVQQKIDGFCRNEDVMRHIAAKLAKLGIEKTTQQIREKLKKLRAQYKAIKMHNSRSGVNRKKFPYHDLMDSVLGHRPCTSGETVRDNLLLQEPDALSSGVSESSNSSPPPESLSPDVFSSPNPVLEETTHDAEVASFMIAATSTATRPSTPTFREPSHRTPPRKRRDTTMSMDFLAALKDISDKDREAERELRREEAKVESEERGRERASEQQLRRQEMEQELQLRREEMELRRRESRDLCALFRTLVPQKP